MEAERKPRRDRWAIRVVNSNEFIALVGAVLVALLAAWLYSNLAEAGDRSPPQRPRTTHSQRGAAPGACSRSWARSARVRRPRGACARFATGTVCCHACVVAYLGNLTCRDCGLTFTSRWGSFEGADEYRCEHDHVVHVAPRTAAVVAIDGALVEAATLAELRGRCPACATELATGRLPRCPVCGGRDHDVLLAGTIG